MFIALFTSNYTGRAHDVSIPLHTPATRGDHTNVTCLYVLWGIVGTYKRTKNPQTSPIRSASHLIASTWLGGCIDSSFENILTLSRIARSRPLYGSENTSPCAPAIAEHAAAADTRPECSRGGTLQCDVAVVAHAHGRNEPQLEQRQAPRGALRTKYSPAIPAVVLRGAS